MNYTPEQVAAAMARLVSDDIDEIEMLNEQLAGADPARILVDRVRKLEEELSETKKDFGCLAELLDGHDATECRDHLVRMRREVIELRHILSEVNERGGVFSFALPRSPSQAAEWKALRARADKALAAPSAVNEDVAAMLRGSLRKREDDPAPPMPDFSKGGASVQKIQPEVGKSYRLRNGKIAVMHSMGDRDIYSTIDGEPFYFFFDGTPRAPHVTSPEFDIVAEEGGQS